MKMVYKFIRFNKAGILVNEIGIVKE
jgi:hypothetical protein